MAWKHLHSHSFPNFQTDAPGGAIFPSHELSLNFACISCLDSEKSLHIAIQANYCNICFIKIIISHDPSGHQLEDDSWDVQAGVPV